MKKTVRFRVLGHWAGLLFALLLAPVLASAQTAARNRPAPLAATELAADGTPFFIRLAPGTGPALAGPQVLRQQLGLGQADELRPLRTETDALGMMHERFQQYYQGVKVEHGQYSLHTRHGRVEALSGELKRPAGGLSTVPALGAAAALKHALAAVGARRYKWQVADEEAELRQRTGQAQATYQPTGELVLVGDFRQPAAARPLVLAWKFDVYAQEPVSRDLLYVDARTGAVVLRDAVIKHLDAPGTLATRYLGSRPSTTEAFAGGFRLRETTRSKGITTLNCHQLRSFGGATDFVDNDNNWSAAEYNNAAFDNAALDAHLGAQTTQDYWTTVHGRDSYDNRGTVLLSYVHYDTGFDNAFWDGTEMVYGDGGNRFRPLTAVDVCGHEIGHAVCATTANLVYRDESGALNEGFSDIWGACVEHHLDPTKQIWLVGEDIDMQRPSLRSMSNPNAERQPDTYQGTFWYAGPGDNGGVHTNSGVLNYWFYLLSEGGTGTNDLGTAYSVSGITIQQAARIAYRAEQFYLPSSATYAVARTATLQAAVDLFGFGSAQVTAVAQAWRAVGLDLPAPTLSGLTPSSGPVGQVVTLSGSNLGTVFRVTFNGTAATAGTLLSASQLSVTVPAGATTGAVVVTNPSGAATSPGVFTVTSSGPAPTLLSYAPAAGQRTGQPVVVTGTNLGGTTDLTIGGAVAAFVINSPTQLTATVPATATSGLLTATTGGGSASVAFAVLPYVASFSPSSGPSGTRVTVTGTSLLGALGVKFNGVYAAYSPSAATSVATTVPVGATTGPLAVRTAAGTATSAGNFVVTAALNLLSFQPASGVPAVTAVTVLGEGFTGATAVTFGGVAATTFRVVSDTEVWATVPATAATGLIGVSTPLGTAASRTAFVVLVPAVPVITRFTPGSGYAGAAVTLSGSGFVGASSVSFNGVASPGFLVVDNNTIAVNVPTGATTGPVRVTTAAGTGQSSSSFVVFVAGPPVVSGFSPGSGPVGSTVLVTGTDFTRTTAVTFNGVAAVNFYVYGTNQVQVQVPVGATTGPIGVVSPLGTGLSATSFVVVPPGTPSVTNLSPGVGTVGTSVAVYGTDFGGVTRVAFNGLAATTFYVSSNTYLTATVPVGATTGPVSVTSPIGTGRSANSFVVTVPGVPYINNFSPFSGPVGTSVAVYGTDFAGATQVSFNGLNANTFSVSNNNNLTAVVPVGATTGPIRVSSALGTGQSIYNFVVTVPGVPLINTFYPSQGAPGTVVNVTGNDFVGITAIFFNGLAASSFTVLSNSSLTATVPAGASTGLISATSALGTGTSTSDFTVLVPPTNDLCSATVPVLACGGTVNGTTLGATTTGDPTGSCGPYITNAGGVFYRFAGNGNTVTLSMCGGGTNFDSELFVFSGTCGNYTCVAGNDDSCGLASTVSFAAASGTDYLIYVSGYSYGQGNFSLSASCAGPALAITAVAPLANAAAAGRTAPLALAFNQPLTAASAGALRVFSAQRGGLRSRGTTPAVVSGSSLAFAPTGAPWRAGETVSYTVTTAAASSSGPLGLARVGQFTAAVTGSGLGYFSAGTDVPVGSPTGATVGDVDGDGDLDLVTPNFNSSTVSVRLNNGTGTFTAGSITAVGQGPDNVALGDVDGDGDLDLLSTNSRASTVSVRLNNGSGVFSQSSADVLAGPKILALGDVDGDGDLDLVTAYYGNPNYLSVLFNYNGSFTGNASFPTVGSNPQGVALGDVDGDGDLDLLCANTTSLVSVRLNDGIGGFFGGNDLVLGFIPAGLALGDVDGDGDLDLVTANGSSGTLSVRPNLGNGTFGTGSNVGASGNPTKVVLGDVDGDGDLDIFAMSQELNGRVHVRVNNGTGSFSLPAAANAAVAVGATPQALAVADLDGDGDLDLLANTDGNGAPAVSIRLNQRVLAARTGQAAVAFALSPNPTRTATTLSGAAPHAPVQVLDVLGRAVLTATADANGTAHLVLPAGLASGVYLVGCGGQVRRLEVE